MGAWAWTVTVCGVSGRVRETEAIPEESVRAITWVPLLVPVESVPALVVKRMLAPAAAPPEDPGRGSR